MTPHNLHIFNLVDPASSHMFVLVCLHSQQLSQSCCTHLITHPSHTRWLKARDVEMNASSLITILTQRLEARCGELKSQTGNRPITLASTKKYQLVEAAVTELLWSRDTAERETVEQLRLARQELRQEEELQPEIKEPAMERNIPIGKPQVKEAFIRDLMR